MSGAVIRPRWLWLLEGGPRQRLTKKQGPLRGPKDLEGRGMASEPTLSISNTGLLMREPRLKELH